MEIRCPNCGWTSEPAQETIAAAIAAAEQRQADHHIEHCPRCQWVIRVPLEELRAAAQAPALSLAVSAEAVAAPEAMPAPPKPAWCTLVTSRW